MSDTGCLEEEQAGGMVDGGPPVATVLCSVRRGGLFNALQAKGCVWLHVMAVPFASMRRVWGEVAENWFGRVKCTAV